MKCRLAALVVVLGCAAGLSGAVRASGGAPASVVFDAELVGSWSAVGNTLFADPGAWSGSPTLVQPQWFRCDATGGNCTAIAGATGFLYTLASADSGKTVYAVVTATNASGSGSVATELSGVVGAPTVVSQPVITGDANVDGTTLSVSHGTWTGSPTSYAYQWYSCDGTSLQCSAIPGATSSTYLVSVVALNGDYLTVDVTASDASGSADNVAHPSFAIGEAHTDVISSGSPTGVPVAVVSPYWTGDASTTGNVLVADTGVWTNHPTSLSYAWYRCTPACSPISGTSGQLTYTVQAADAGASIDFMVDAFNNLGTSARYGFYGYLVNNTYISQSGPAGAPEPRWPPELTGDAEGVGTTVTVTAESWYAPQDPNISIGYQWVRCDGTGANCSSIPGATFSSYALTSSDIGHTIYVVVDATNGYGTTSIASTTLTPPIGSPVDTDPPTIGGDTSGAGNTVTATTGIWLNSPTSFRYQWYSCDASGGNCSAIAGATGSTYQTVAGDLNGTLVVEVDATNAHGTGSAFSLPSDVIGSPYAATAPVLGSTDLLPGGIPIAELGDTLSVTRGTWNGSPTSYAYQWYRCVPSSPTADDFTNCGAIGGATSSSYTAVSADLGHTLFVEVTATNGVGTGVAYAEPRGSVGVPQPLLDDGSVTGTAQVGQTLTLTNGSSWAGATPITWSYSWERCDTAGANCVSIAGATAATYTLVAADQGHVLQGVVEGSNVWGANGWGLAYDSTVVAAAPGSSGGGGGGGGGSGPLDLSIEVGVSPTQIAPGGSATFHITVTDLTKTAATNLRVFVQLPPGAQLVSSYADRGPGCKPDTTYPDELYCYLDYLAASPTVANIVVTLAFPAAGTETLSANVNADQADVDSSNNVAAADVQVGTTTPAPPPLPPPTPTPAPKPPVLKQLNARTLSGVVRGATESVAGRFSVNEPLRLRLTVSKLDTARRIALRRKSSLAGKSITATTFVVTRSVAHAGVYTFQAVIERRGLTRGGRYVIHLSGTNAAGATRSLAVPFRA